MSDATRGRAREVATRVLFRIASEDAYASPALDAEIARARLDARDAAQATEIVYGALRVLPALDAAIDAERPKKNALDAWALAALRAATYQLLHLRVPAHAAVSDAVAIVRRKRGEGLARFANAVLRKVAAKRPEDAASPTRVEVPAWVREALVRSLGPARTERFLDARRLPPPLGLRVGEGVDREALARRMEEARPSAEVRLDPISPLGLLVRGAGDPRALPGYDEGLFAVQDAGSQVVALLLGAREGEEVADACAGRGGKTALLAARVGVGGRVTAIDLHERKLEQIPSELARLHVETPLAIEAIDLSVGTGGLPPRFDRVLCDAPCTGLGTLHRRPEILLRLGPEDPARMAALQLRIAESAAALVRPGGVLALAVCSPTHEEGIALAQALQERVPELELVRDALPDVAIAPDAGGLFRIGPWSAAEDLDWGSDAYQVARFRKRDSA